MSEIVKLDTDLNRQIADEGDVCSSPVLLSGDTAPTDVNPVSHSTTIKNYNHYFSSGFYKLRYPRVNQHVRSLINRYISLGKDTAKAGEEPPQYILDYGCGNGRYLVSLLLEHPRLHFTAFDIAIAPLEALREKLITIGAQAQVDIIHRIEDLPEPSANREPSVNEEPSAKKQHFDIALLLFGVLSHIPSAKDRHELLVYIQQSLCPQSGTFILSVPNKQRRFRALQKQQNSHEIAYSRTINNQTTDFYYHLYDSSTIQQALAAAGLTVIKVRAESVLPESWVTRSVLLGWLDHQLVKVIPAQWGYGILVHCKKHTSL